MDYLKRERIIKFIESTGLSLIVMSQRQANALEEQLSKEYDENPEKFIPYRPKEEWGKVHKLPEVPPIEGENGFYE